ncbi:cupin domain-containing protein [Vibrio alginolyticus]|nr:cupin domain-containing protein [Vibrio alginolyticus]
MKSYLILFASLMAVSGGVYATQNYETANIASPEQYETLFENENVLVLKMVLEPGESDKIHRHNDETVYFQQGGTLTITENGKAQTMEIPDGFVMWHPAWVHQVTNSGNSRVVAIVVEQKK